MLIKLDAWLSSAVHIFAAFGQCDRLVLNASQCAAATTRHSTNPCYASSRALYVRRRNINLLNPRINCIDFVELEWCTGTGGSLVHSGLPWGCASTLGFSGLSANQSLQISLTVSRVAIS